MSLGKNVWSGTLAVVGAVAGLAAFVYFIGAVTLWLALRSTDYSPDAAIEHQSKSQVIAVGLRGILVVFGIALVLALVPIARGIWLRRALARARGIVPARSPRPERGVAVALIVLFLLWRTSGTSWRWLTLAIVASAFLLLLVFAFRWWHAPAILLAAVLAALSWQYGGPVNVRAAIVLPRSSQPIEGIRLGMKRCTGDGTTLASLHTRRRGDVVFIADRNPCRFTPAMARPALMNHFRRVCSVPYFGQSTGFVYLGAIRNVWQNAARDCVWDAGPIVERRRDRVRLRFLRGEAFLNRDRSRPRDAARDTLESLVEAVE